MTENRQHFTDVLLDVHADVGHCGRALGGQGYEGDQLPRL